MALYENLFTAHPGESVGFERKGWLCVYRTPSGLRDGIVQARSVGQFGVSWQQLSEPEVRALEPALVPGLAGSIFYAADAGVNPYRLVRFVAGLARERGATITTGAGVRRFRVKGRRVQAAVTERSEIWAETFVVAAGAWSSRLLETIGLRLSMQPAKGYSLTFPLEPDSPRTPLSLGESHVVVSPLGQQLRLTGGLELVGLDRSLNERKLDAIWRAARSYLPGLSQRVATERWYGFRPLSPDGLPVIGPLPAFDNLVVATGHGTLGVTLAPITGHLVADLITTRSIPREAEPLLPSRFGRESRSMELCQPSLEQASLGVIVDQR
jgi:D-amino-acid dehydrogenase